VLFLPLLRVTVEPDLVAVFIEHPLGTDHLAAGRGGLQGIVNIDLSPALPAAHQIPGYMSYGVPKENLSGLKIFLPHTISSTPSRSLCGNSPSLPGVYTLQ